MPQMSVTKAVVLSCTLCMQVYGPDPIQHAGVLACRPLLDKPWLRVWCSEGLDGEVPLCNHTRLLICWIRV